MLQELGISEETINFLHEEELKIFSEYEPIEYISTRIKKPETKRAPRLWYLPVYAQTHVKSSFTSISPYATAYSKPLPIYNILIYTMIYAPLQVNVCK